MAADEIVVEPETAPRGVVGSPRPEVWLVGDEKARLGPLEEVPFYAEGISHQLLSGTLLFGAMEAAGLTWDVAALSNSRLWQRDVDLAKTYEELDSPEVVVALGKAASGRLATHGVAHRVVPHPQFWRRFRHREPEAYAQVLREAAERPVGAGKVEA
jgi:hypothetical protein